MSPKRILILGPESTGKSTLCKELSTYFSEPWVPEFARNYLLNLKTEYDFSDLSTIAKGQIETEDVLASEAKRFLFCDTDLRVIHIWSEVKYGKTEPWILEEIERRKYDLILLCDIDLPWTDDPLREHPDPEMRKFLFDQYLRLSQESGSPFVIISGDGETRLSKAIEAMKAQ